MNNEELRIKTLPRIHTNLQCTIYNVHSATNDANFHEYIKTKKPREAGLFLYHIFSYSLSLLPEGTVSSRRRNIEKKNPAVITITPSQTRFT